jgi:hypothetical protein
MTVAVAFLCPDGVVVAADSMITPTLGGMGVGHHTGRKVYTCPGQQVFAWAGDMGLASRARLLVEANPASAGVYATPMDYVHTISTAINAQFSQTQVQQQNRNEVACFVGFPHGGQPQCCVFWMGMQPMLFDQDHYYLALGTGKLSADPFLKFLVDVFCPNNTRPSVHLAAFLAVWTVQHAIDTTQGQVALPIKAAMIEQAAAGLQSRALSDPEIATHIQAKQAGEQALRDWRAAVQSGAAAQGAQPPIPQPAAAAPAAAAPVAAAPAAAAPGGNNP